MVVHVYDLSTWEVEVGASAVQGQPQLQGILSEQNKQKPGS